MKGGRGHSRLLVEAVADLERGDALSQAGRELGVNRRLHEDAVRAHAGLTGAAELARDRT